MSAISAMFIVYALNTQPFKDERIPFYIKYLKINAVFRLKTVKLISIEVLQQIIMVCNALQHPVLYKALYLFSFFSFLRLSNILPHSAAAFDITRHLTRSDVIFGKKFATIILKWSKTMQDRKETSTFSIPMLGESPLCPIAALQQMFAHIPVSKNSPLFVFHKNGATVPLADSTAQEAFEAGFFHITSISTLYFPFVSKICHYMGLSKWGLLARNHETWYLVFPGSVVLHQIHPCCLLSGFSCFSAPSFSLVWHLAVFFYIPLCFLL